MCGTMSRPDKEANWNPALYDAKLGFVSQYGKAAVDLLDPKPGESVLDIGCGTGDLCRLIADRGADPLGIDRSAEMIGRAREKFPELPFLEADAHTYRTARKFDAVFSNAALHWMLKPDDVALTVWEALAPGGRFAAEFGGKGCIQALYESIRDALAAYGIDAQARRPWYFPSVGEYASLLEKTGFRVEYAAHFARPTPLDGGEDGLDHWLDTFAYVFFEGLSETEKREAYRAVKKLAKPRLFQDGRWVADYWRIRILAFKPAE
jgi:trans-aconitate methyltransferase